ncbi:uncharacterized protein LOC111714529 isoform X2 [Eurytemora carolleeae]|uniref:uncharacterized protein LOC111714529 isoform X1 n=1 Tax=Eurytemora carolleeae TaxID=1294199 RepID=UPI000C777E55|nr:uncharacterized protein LOC111714529 isoform X1 [Eurytemora carolleeae]XP_023345431.1 uncharacterized protein LOC111714529 isoform X2 [Eurytemora carolleeae]|eukprot:XP_023345430.1 uncharacterized protein LOC111714529 isoform X1 [Eurytemora affinis]
MILPELILSTSILSLALFVWAVLAKYKKEGKTRFSDGEGSSEDEEEDEGEGDCSSKENFVDETLLESCGSSVCGESAKDETPLSSTPGTPKATSGLSRRQRKNRKKEDKGPKKSKSPILSRTSSEELKPDLTRSKKNSVPCKQYTKLNMPDKDIYQLLTSYLLPTDQLRLLGYPMDSTLFPGKAYIYRDPEISSLLHETADYDDGDICDQGSATLDATAQPFFPEQGYQFMLNKYSQSENSVPVLNATAKEFVPSNLESSDDSEKKTLKGVQSSPNLENTEEWIPSLVSVPSSPNLLDPSSLQHISSSNSSKTNPASISSKLTSDEEESMYDERRCVRCTKTFFMYSGGEYYTQESCTYHWGKLRSQNKNNPIYQCCGGRAGRSSSRGCSVAQVHVWSGFPLSRGIVGPLDGYVKTRYRKSLQKERNFGVFGVDCEMCYTRVGLELTKVTIVGVDGRLVYESLVNPENSIVDHNTRFSGISERDLNVGPTKSLKEVQNDLNGFINADSILIGHGLENDLRALNLLHLNVIDTSLVFPHFYGLPYRRSLRTLVSSYLKRDIQGNAWGHDSYEDARACVELMLWKVRKDLEKARKLEIPGRKI